MRIVLLFICFWFSSLQLSAQNQQVRKGNKLYKEQQYGEATEAYKQALSKDPKHEQGLFNLGNALYKQKNYTGARQTLETTANQSRDRMVKAEAWYNIGNSFMEEQQWQQALDAYKQSLRLNPQDEQAKYNLSYALQMLKKDQGGGGQNNDQKENEDQQDQQQQQQQDQQQDNQQQEQQNQEQQNQEQQNQEQQQQPSKLSEQQAEQLLNALSQEEKKLHDKKEKGRAIQVKTNKDW